MILINTTEVAYTLLLFKQNKTWLNDFTIYYALFYTTCGLSSNVDWFEEFPYDRLAKGKLIFTVWLQHLYKTGYVSGEREVSGTQIKDPFSKKLKYSTWKYPTWGE